MKIEKDKYYLIRTEDTSVYFGRITEKDGQEVTMTECRCIWYWSGAASLNQLANEGVKNPDDCTPKASIRRIRRDYCFTATAEREKAFMRLVL